MTIRILGPVFLLAVALIALPSHAQTTCIQNYFDKSKNAAPGAVASDVTRLISQITAAFALPSSQITIIACSGVTRVQYDYYDAVRAKAETVPGGDYIFYDPVWVREVIGPEISGSNRAEASDEATFLFGHELGHILGRHRTSSDGKSRLEKETEADGFAGCAAGALAADWKNISKFIARLRGDVDTTYPAREKSLLVAKNGFDKCRQLAQTSSFVVAGKGPDFHPPKMNGRTLDGCIIDEQHPAGNNCAAQAQQTIAAQFCEQAGFLTAAAFTTEYTPVFKSSYKLIKRVDSDGRSIFAWNKDDTGGFIIKSVSCRAADQGPS